MTPRHDAPSTQSLLDAAADICRRAWVACAHCRDDRHCPSCRAGRSCESHWRYLLATTGGHLFLQCPTCLQRWWHDTEFGRGGRPLTLDDLLDGPWPGPDRTTGC